jgi:hypothetical protein
MRREGRTAIEDGMDASAVIEGGCGRSVGDAVFIHF